MADNNQPQPNTFIPQIVSVGKWFAAAPGRITDRIIGSITSGDESDSLGTITITPSNRLEIRGQNLGSYTRARIFDSLGSSRVVPGNLDHKIIDAASEVEPESLTLPLLDYGEDEFSFNLFLDSTEPGVAPLRLTQKFAFKKETEEEKKKRQQKQAEADKKQKEAEAADFENKETQNLHKLGSLNSEQPSKPAESKNTAQPKSGIAGDKLKYKREENKKEDNNTEGNKSPVSKGIEKKLNPLENPDSLTQAEPTVHKWQQKSVVQTGNTGSLPHVSAQQAFNEPLQNTPEKVTLNTQANNGAESLPVNKQEENANQQEFRNVNRQTPKIINPNSPPLTPNIPNAKVTSSPLIVEKPNASFLDISAPDTKKSSIGAKAVTASEPLIITPKQAQIKQETNSQKSVALGLAQSLGAKSQVSFDEDVKEAYQLIDAEMDIRKNEYMIKNTISGNLEMDNKAYQKVRGQIQNQVWGRFAIEHPDKAENFRKEIIELDQTMSQQDSTAQQVITQSLINRGSGVNKLSSQKIVTERQGVALGGKNTLTEKNTEENIGLTGKIQGLKKQDKTVRLNLEAKGLVKPQKSALGITKGTKSLISEAGLAGGTSLAAQNILKEKLKERDVKSTELEETERVKNSANIQNVQNTAQNEPEEQEEAEEDEEEINVGAKFETTDFDNDLPVEFQADIRALKMGGNISASRKQKIEQARIKHIVNAANTSLDSLLNSLAIVIWGSVLLIPVGAIVGDLLPLVKNTLGGWAIKKFLKTESLKKQASIIVSQIKLSGKIKAQILAMNLVTLIVPIVLIIIILVVGCTLPLPGSLSFFGLSGNGNICESINNISNVGTNLGSSAAVTVTTGGKCSALLTGPASTANLAGSCFGNNAPQASAIAGAESGGQATAQSKTDICTVDGTPVSFGLFQINISANPIRKITGTDANGKYSYGVTLDCPSAFTHPYTGSRKDCALKPGMQGLYQQCVAAAQDPASNIVTACYIAQIKNINSKAVWNAWGANSKCEFH